MLDERIVAVQQRARGEGQVLETELGQSIDDLVDDLVTLPEGVMKRDGHPVLQSRSLDGFFQRSAQPPVQFGLRACEIRRLGVRSGKQPQLAERRVLRFQLIDGAVHSCRSSDYCDGIQAAAAICRTISASSITGGSTILPSSDTTPSPLRCASSAAASTLFA